MRSFVVVMGVAVVGGVVAAPVPRDREQDPICYPTRVGDRMAHARHGYEEVEVVMNVERVPDGLEVTTGTVQKSGILHPTATVLVSAGGLVQVWHCGRTMASRPRTLRLPHADDNRWTCRWDVGEHDWSMRTLGWEDVEVPAGRFRAIKVERVEEGLGVTLTWYAPRVGMVRCDFDDKSTVLTSFTPGK